MLRHFQKEADRNNKIILLSKALSKQITVTFESKKDEFTDNILEDEKASLEHIYAEAREIKDSSNTDDTYSSDDRSPDKPHIECSGPGDTLHHTVGPDAGQLASKTDYLSASPPVAANGLKGVPENDGGIYHVLEECLNDSERVYKYTVFSLNVF